MDHGTRASCQFETGIPSDYMFGVKNDDEDVNN